MLDYFRQNSLRKSLWLIILFASLFMQMQSVFSCELMGNEPQTHCCCNQINRNACPMGGGCHALDNDLSTDCCEASAKIDVGLQSVVVADVHYNKYILSLEASQPPPAVVIEFQVVPLKQSRFNRLVLDIFTQSIASLGTNTYFETRRFRI